MVEKKGEKEGYFSPELAFSTSFHIASLDAKHSFNENTFEITTNP